ncbi:hypothetical protein PBOI14_26360 [Pseudomonas sp. Boi14]|nr:hypothetical protein PBOI14_26360 [Pseudomonas sp. Boi14]
MKFSEQWLRGWVSPQVSRDELVARLSMAGLEVDSVTPAAGDFSGVVVGEVLSTEQHPDADKLRVCQVSNGSETFQVVCGAPNVRPGLKVPFAMIGAQLPGDFKIKKAKLRGVESNGMLCSQAELQIGEGNDGLMELPVDAPVGEDVRTYLSLDDASIEVDLTPNRGDCLSLAGMAREVGALYAAKVQRPEVPAIPAAHDEVRPVEVLAPAACPRYLGRVVRNVDLSKPTPLWMVERLRRADVRSIDAAVDITNYVMLELGQPLHAFDLAEINGGIRVRMAEEGEKLVLLDGQEVTLRSDTLVIADHTRALAIAGVMGGSTVASPPIPVTYSWKVPSSTRSRLLARHAPMACIPMLPIAMSVVWTGSLLAKPWSGLLACCWKSRAATRGRSLKRSASSICHPLRLSPCALNASLRCWAWKSTASR